MTARQETSVSIAMADVLDFGRARIRREAERTARLQEEARQLAERATRLAAEQAEAKRTLARQEAAKQAASQAALLARQEREARFQVLLASRVATIAAQNERDLAALRKEYANRPIRAKPALAIAVTVSALLMLVAAVGCLVGTVLTDRPPIDPEAGRASMLPKSQAGAARAAPAPFEPVAFASGLLLHREANPDRPPRAIPELSISTRAPRAPRATAPTPGKPPVRCALLGPLGCLND